MDWPFQINWRSDGGVIPVTDGNGNIHVAAVHVVLSVMGWPNSPREAFVFADTWIKDLMISADGSVSTFTEKNKQEFLRKRVYGGKLVGHILTHYISLARHYPEIASINKAQHLVYTHFMRDNVKEPAAKRTLERYWSEFKGGAHLWAAFVSCPNLLLRDVSGFLIAAATLNQIAEDYGLKLRDPPWNPPNDLPLPVSEMDFNIPRLTAEGEAALKSYKAPRSDW